MVMAMLEEVEAEMMEVEEIVEMEEMVEMVRIVDKAWMIKEVNMETNTDKAMARAYSTTKKTAPPSSTQTAI